VFSQLENRPAASASHRIALITGASRGIGAATARLLAHRGMFVAVNYRTSRQEALDVVHTIRADGGQAMAVEGDVREHSAVIEMTARVRARWGDVEVLVHNALIPYAIASFDEITWQELGGKVDQEKRAAFELTKAVLPAMLERRYG
jgi:3-oxoacyl-[acyl-carrier protein] reductase